MNVFHYTATAAVPGWENSGDPDHNDNDFFREGLIYNIIVCLAVCLSGCQATSAALFILIDEFRSASVRMASPLLPLHNFLRLRCEFLAESMRKFRSAFGAGVFSSSTELAPISLKIGGNPFGGYYHRPPPPSTSVVPQDYAHGQGGRAASPITAKHFTTGQRRPGCEEAKQLWRPPRR